MAGVPLVAPIRVDATTIRGTIPAAAAPGLATVEARSGSEAGYLQGRPFAFGPALDIAIGGSASYGGFVRAALQAAPNRGAMLWLSTGYSAAPISVLPIAFHALTDPLVLIPIYFGATDATGRLELRLPFSADPYLSSAPMVMQAMALQVFPFDGSFTNAAVVIVPP
ncbi:MAG: hypothetical protein IPN34_01710 [Planctomycetes bacterium]|nr:hypothetical protein [Planctomycetota bacterium]